MVRQKPAKLPSLSSNLSATYFFSGIKPMLYLASTPIGNLGDITLRTLETLKNCTLILCEDTRHSAPLLLHYKIEVPLQSYHKFNESAKIAPLLVRLKNGEDIALITDAGTPLISDPGLLLARACLEQNTPITALPGACAPIVALTLSGFNAELFQFVGFLPKLTSALAEKCIEMLCYSGTSIAFESPHRLKESLALIDKLDKKRRVCVLREMTKKFEERICGSASEVLSHFSGEIKGEIVLLIEGALDKPKWPDLFTAEEAIKAEVEWLSKSFSLPLQDAIKLCAKISDTPKRLIYKHFINEHKTP